MNDLVSIITPVYNAEKYVMQTIDSVLFQTYRNWELILVDDKSTDNSVALISGTLAKDKRIQLIQLSVNSGVAEARNAAIRAARGKYLAFLDSDDLWDKHKLERQLHFMIKKKAVLTYTAYKKMDKAGNIGKEVVYVKNHLNYSELLYSTIGCLTVIYDQEKLGKMYMQKIGHEDFAFWLNILKRGYTAYGLNEPLAVYRVTQNSISGNKIRAAGYVWNVYRNVEHLSFYLSLKCFLKYSFISFRKYLI